MEDESGRDRYTVIWTGASESTRIYLDGVFIPAVTEAGITLSEADGEMLHFVVEVPTKYANIRLS